MSSPLQAFGAFAAQLQIGQCPPALVEKARALLLYGVAVGASSADSRIPAQVSTALRSEYGAGGAATNLVDGLPMAAAGAAFCNGALFHVRIQDDAHPAGHMGTIILPAALAQAEALDASGEELLAAIIGAYEVSLRVGRDHAADLSSRGFRTTPIYGALGAAAACARLQSLDAAHTANALALTVHAVAGLREFADAGTDEYPFQAGYAARNGLTAALLAAQGLIGTDTALTGRAGLLPVYGDPSKDYGSRLLDGLGSYYETLKVTYKPYPGGQFHRGVIRGFAQLSEAAGGAEIESAAIHMHPFEAGYLGLAYNGPFRTYTEAFFSMPFCAALAWLHRTVTFAALNRLDDPAALAAVARIHVVSDGSRARYKPYLRVALKDGRVLEWEDDSGEESYILTWDIAVRMTHELFAEVGLPEGYAQALIEAAHGIGAAKNVAQLMQAANHAAQAVRKRTAG
ncbi:MAG TPA: MmgE/PrpD family protein [Burkholderiales bacterium]|nr:MmgE/PrpD family protein [Burkholderiales bacterium]